MGKTASGLGQKLGSCGGGAAGGLGALAGGCGGGGGGNPLGGMGSSIGDKLSQKFQALMPGNGGGGDPTGGASGMEMSPTQRPPIQGGMSQEPSSMPIGIPRGLDPQQQQDMYQNRWKRYYQ